MCAQEVDERNKTPEQQTITYTIMDIVSGAEIDICILSLNCLMRSVRGPTANFLIGSKHRPVDMSLIVTEICVIHPPHKFFMKAIYESDRPMLYEGCAARKSREFVIPIYDAKNRFGIIKIPNGHSNKEGLLSVGS